MKKALLLSCAVLVLFIGIASCHQPRIVMGVVNSQEKPILIEEPEISKAYYGELAGHPDYYEIRYDKPFSLYVNILVPDIPSERNRKFSVNVTDSMNTQIIFLDGENYNWTVFFEPFGQDSYMEGPEERKNVSSGIYRIKVFSQDNIGKYSLAVGEEESFPPEEILRSMISIPTLKAIFFNKPLEMFFNVAGLIILAVLTILVLIFLFIKIILWALGRSMTKTTEDDAY